MSRNHKFYNPEGLYFINFADWLDVVVGNFKPHDAIVRQRGE
ncbi:Uncharacterised protein [Chryseobacterium taihuense]|uniref:Uncharacterized protein n=1 Tax=Chryseobacterium taihuense TaxID=1141221 RepID=A0A4U8WFB5_9FLAO|nr:Uncharacterised protein [Chryseobacterium taihuense]